MKGYSKKVPELSPYERFQVEQYGDILEKKNAPDEEFENGHSNSYRHQREVSEIEQYWLIENEFLS